MGTYSDIKSRINDGTLVLPTLSIPAFQVWVGGDIDERVLELAVLQRKACAHYTLIAPANSPLINLLVPDVFKDVDKVLELALSEHAQVRAYHERWSSDIEASDIVRFYELSKNADQVYLDMDVLLLEIPVRFTRSIVTLADVFIMYGGSNTALFADCLAGLAPALSHNAMRGMLARSEYQTIPPKSYFHYDRGARA